MNQAKLVQITKVIITAVHQKTLALMRAFWAQVAARRHRFEPVLRPVGRLTGAIRDRMAPLYEGARSWLAAHDHLLARPRAWARTFGMDRRPVQAVGAMMILGALYAAIWDPFVRPVPDAPAIVAERLAPVGTVNLLPMSGAQLADERDATRLPASSVY